MEVGTQSFKSGSASLRIRVRILLRYKTKLKGLQEIFVTRLSKLFPNLDT